VDRDVPVRSVGWRGRGGGNKGAPVVQNADRAGLLRGAYRRAALRAD